MQRKITSGFGVAAAIALTMTWLALFAGTATASGACDLFAAPGGSDGAAGTEAAPFQSAQHLADSLSAGQTGCFRAGAYTFPELKVTRSNVTLTGYPGETATLSGRVWIAEGADHVTVSNLHLDGRNSRDLPSPVVDSIGATFDSVDVTNYHTDICFKLGDAEYGRAVETTIENSRIHDCGKIPSTNREHGIYIGQSNGAVIRDNWIYDNTDRGIQVYPDAQGTQIVGNVIDGNGEGIVISGDGATASSGTRVQDNVIGNSQIRWNVESNWPGGVVGSDNLVSDNCLYASNASSYYNMNGGVLPVSEGAQGFVAVDNVTVNPQFVDRGAKDFTLRSGSPCTAAGLSRTPAAATIVISAARPVSTPDAAKRPAKTRARVLVVGRATTPTSKRIKIVSWQNGGWHKVADVHAKRSGSFRAHARLRLTGDARKVRMRALVPGVSSSRPVVLRLN
jgi:hypothetical protein